MDLFTDPDLFRFIGNYTYLQNLCDTSSLLLTLKKYLIYKLNSTYSLLYYDDISFRQRVLNKIFNHNTFARTNVINSLLYFFIII